MDSDDDDVPQLRADTLAALQEFLQSRVDSETQPSDNNSENQERLFQKDLSESFPEDWQMSQFWYDDHTSNTLAAEVLRLAGDKGNIACLSCPSIFRACRGAKNAFVFEYDRRFQAFGSSYIFYDYNHPEEIPEDCRSAYEVIIADPPFLSEECLTKLAEAVRLLQKADSKIILCTGAVMTENAEKLLSLKKTKFEPHHKNNLGNEFACFANYEMDL
ncbi:unnamed protein product [Allacma fusca]|uniref:Protein-lysine N-methyltransferase AFUS01_LOCUS39007 n=1 Tax=Allacma fusca TaxID=39272 RepID=A0A8J2LUY9_9HEXA|nr:unnamed protein product [Allacma fusca]